MVNDVYIVRAVRTPQAKAGLDLKEIAAPHLAIGLLRNILDCFPSIPLEAYDEVILGNIGAPPQYSNISRVVALESGLPSSISAYTVNRNCAAGMEALSEGFLKISQGRSNLIFAGGLESMSSAPLLFSKEMTDFFINMMKVKSFGEKLKLFSTFRPSFLKPIIAIEKGLTDPFCGLNMGQTAELLARELGISREEQDLYAHNSHLKAAKAIKEGLFQEEIVPLLIGSKMDRILTHDVGPRGDSKYERLLEMKPFFERKSGTVTIGNSCPITDGGSLTLLASKEAVDKYQLKPIGKIVDYSFQGVPPQYMGLGPVSAISDLLERTNKEMGDIDLFEINEAFAAQVIGCLKVLKDKKIAEKMGIKSKQGELPLEKLNVNGGGIALGHPVGSTGCRIVVTLLHELRRVKAKFGVASLCIGGGQGGAILIQNLEA